ncbi:hypothetical protein AXF42_Ash001103 [Apostasia shenzhenica]|uniref:Uncharacterized protein n=1 Tax=Apostasia shenzhenica TaxID=1088818 RepID=A0A2I0ATZ8_9ASPA|nr:hypothetical protein AXF42_Ash001103 [Apostasia shenzhenica]
MMNVYPQILTFFEERYIYSEGTWKVLRIAQALLQFSSTGIIPLLQTGLWRAFSNRALSILME